MKVVNIHIDLYSLDELCKESKERAISEHKEFLDCTTYVDEEYHEDNHTLEEVIKSIEINEYLYYADGEMANCVTFTSTNRSFYINEKGSYLIKDVI